MPTAATQPADAPEDHGDQTPASDGPSSPSDRSDIRLAAVVAGLLAVAATVLLGRSLLGQQTLTATDQLLRFPPWSADAPLGFHGNRGVWGDTYDIWEPQRLLFADEARDGRLALWNPYASGGAPLAAEPSTGTFGPFQLAYLLVPGWYAPGLVKLAELAASAGFTFLFLRAVGTTRTAASIAGAVYGLNGFQLVWTNWPQTRVGALVPALFWAVERCRQRRSTRSVAAVALVVGAMLLEGFPAVTLATGAAAAAYAVVRSIAEADGGGLAQSARRLREAARPALLVGAGLGLGAGLAAIQLLPFQQRLPSLGLERAQSPTDHLEALVAVTMVAPQAFGTTVEMPIRVGGNYVETLSYVGAGAAILALLGLLGGRASAGTVRRGVRLFAGVATLVLLMLIYVGGPGLALLQTVPPLDTNDVGRLRSLLAFFVAVLAGLGVEEVVRRAWTRSSTVPGAGSRPGDAPVSTPVLPAASRSSWTRPRPSQVVLGAVVVVGAVAVGIRLYRWGRSEAYLQELTGDLVVAAVLAALTVGAVLAAWRRPRLLVPGVVLIAALVIGQGSGLWAWYLPVSSRDHWFVRTDMHDFLDENLDGERVATANRTLMAGSTAAYRIRTVTGHVFTQPTWKDMLEAVDPDAFERSPTYSFLRGTPEVATSPVLDRMAARYFATATSDPVFGTVTDPVPAAPGAPPLVLRAGDTVEVGLRADRLRAVRLALAEPTATTDGAARLHVTVRRPDGTVVGTGARRVQGEPNASPTFDVPVDAETATSDGPATELVAEVTFDAHDGEVALATGADGQATVGTITGDDDLRLVFTDGGQVYERTTALPRVRWASQAEVVEDPEARLRRLAAGVPDDTVLLDEAPADPPPAGPDLTPTSTAGADADADQGDVVVVDDGLSTQTVEVDAPQAGYVVVADAVQLGWEATVDGEPAELLHADHAMGAVAVPAGHHVVELRFAPPGRRLGTVVTVLSALAIVVLLALPAIRRRAAHLRR